MIDSTTGLWRKNFLAIRLVALDIRKTVVMQERDYSLLGKDGQKAVKTGLAGANWYATIIPRKEMKEFIRRSDGPAIRDTFIWLAALFGFASFGVALWPSWWSAPFWLAYGVLYGSSTDSRWHECGHGTAFKTRWMNEVVYQLACFMIMRNPVTWKYGHARHHTDTTIVGRDPQILARRPPNLPKMFANLFGLVDVPLAVKSMIQLACGHLTEEEKEYVPNTKRPLAICVARIWLAIYAMTILVAIYMGSILPFMLIGLPRLYGAWHMTITGILQHAALADNVIDHRLNSRTILMNPISRFIYWNMNYHIEHHMFPMVPYHKLPALHERLKLDMPAPNSSTWQAICEAFPVLWKQLKNPEFFLVRDLPPTANPYLWTGREVAADAAE